MYLDIVREVGVMCRFSVIAVFGVELIGNRLRGRLTFKCYFPLKFELVF